ncbi:MAG TPA: hypothetical protein VGS41_12960, partial [Chthonomonadales bacterium]|nr:hypothetical protein [Chthonomonadales bacterium]
MQKRAPAEDRLCEERAGEIRAAQTHRGTGSRAAILLGWTLACAAAAGGCARLPPGENLLSGRRLVVTMHFRAPIDPLAHYFFVI